MPRGRFPPTDDDAAIGLDEQRRDFGDGCRAERGAGDAAGAERGIQGTVGGDARDVRAAAAARAHGAGDDDLSVRLQRHLGGRIGIGAIDGEVQAAVAGEACIQAAVAVQAQHQRVVARGAGGDDLAVALDRQCVQPVGAAAVVDDRTTTAERGVQRAVGQVA